jgi:IS30 family transposase
MKAPKGLTHLLAVVDKFTKWIKARPLAKISSKQAVCFVQDIIFCFRVPNSIITDNGTQFIGKRFLDFCGDNNIQVNWAAVTHPHTNGEVEHANGLILQGLKPCILTQESEDVHARLSARAGRWATEVPSVL